MPYFEHGKIRVHYEIHEGVVERDVLAIHGNLASNIWWKPVIEVLRARAATGTSATLPRGRFIAAEWRGCGRTSGIDSEADLTLPAIAADYNSLMSHLHAKQAGILAHSTGGLIALHMMRSAPELYERALLLDPVGATGVQFGPEMYQAFTMMSQDRAMAEAVMTGTISKFVEDREFLKQIVDAAFGVHPAVWHGVARMLHDHDFRSELPHIHQPVLVLHGDKDQILPLEASRALATGLPHGKFQELPGRGHSTNIEDPALLASFIQQFLLG